MIAPESERLTPGGQIESIRELVEFGARERLGSLGVGDGRG
jgi:hypothetical protein